MGEHNYFICSTTHILMYYAKCEPNQSEMSTEKIFSPAFLTLTVRLYVLHKKRLHDKTVQWMNHEWNQSFSFSSVYSAHCTVLCHTEAENYGRQCNIM